METPLVTVICLCYNHERFVREAIQSVFDQTYHNIQIIVIDAASTDASLDEIRSTIEHREDVMLLALESNEGNCSSFNKGLIHAKGKYIIDFATDDVMMPERIQKQVSFFETLTPDYGIVFTDSAYIDSNGEFLRNHTEYLIDKGIIKQVPQGNVFADVLKTYFISSPTMMIRTEVLIVLGGYDEDSQLYVRGLVCERRHTVTFDFQNLQESRWFSSI